MVAHLSMRHEEYMSLQYDFVRYSFLYPRGLCNTVFANCILLYFLYLLYFLSNVSHSIMVPKYSSGSSARLLSTIRSLLNDVFDDVFCYEMMITLLHTE